MRNGTFYDFAAGYRFTLPVDRLYEIRTPSTGFEDLGVSRLDLEDLRDGGFYQISHGEGDDSDHADFHADLVLGEEITEATTEHTVGSYNGRSANGKMSSHIFTTQRGNTGYVFFVTKEGKMKIEDAEEISKVLKLID